MKALKLSRSLRNLINTKNNRRCRRTVGCVGVLAVFLVTSSLVLQLYLARLTSSVSIFRGICTEKNITSFQLVPRPSILQTTIQERNDGLFKKIRQLTLQERLSEKYKLLSISNFTENSFLLDCQVSLANGKGSKEAKRPVFITVSGGRAGRLGNRMFQYASMFGIAMGARSRGVCAVPVLEPTSHLTSLLYPFNLHSANIPIKVSTILAEDKAMKFTPYILPRISAGYNFTLETYLQSWKYFSKFESYIREEFKFNPEIMQEANDFMVNITGDCDKNVTLVGVHVRRGDMASGYATSRGYIPANDTYLQNALIYYRTRFSTLLFVICTDDLGWAMEHVTGSDVRYSIGHFAEVDMAILSMCDHSIITSGSFGWWAAWLCGGSVVYHKQFPLPGSWLDSICSREDYYPPSWIGLD